ncbi:MAG: hypothetical protein ACJAS4_001468 [Bacteriovoracaceae bacterium]|jgi:hypothetical protein
MNIAMGKTMRKNGVMELNNLKKLLIEGDWEAVNYAQLLGEDSWPILNEIIQNKNFLPKQIAMACAAQLDIKKAGAYLIMGLNDKHINVSLRAAGELSKKRYDGVLPAILKKMSECDFELKGECSILLEALGHYPGDETLNTIKKIQTKNTSHKAEILKTLVKLEDPIAVKNYLQILKDGNSSMKYFAIKDLIYINQEKYFPKLKELLLDKEIGMNVGNPYNNHSRRFCDQAVDTAVEWLGLKTSFKPSNGNYTDTQIAEVLSLIIN